MDVSKYVYIIESKLTPSERKSLPDSEFGIPISRKFPIHDERHVRSAISYFHTCPENLRHELATNISNKIKNNNYDINIPDKIKLYL